MPASVVKRFSWAVAIVGLAAVLVLAALPVVASTRIVRDRIALEMSAWSGYRVELAGAPEIRIWPTLEAVLEDVRFSGWADPERRPVLDVERIELKLSATAAIAGDIAISTARLVRPVLHVSEFAPGRYAPLAPGTGRIRHALEAARAAVAASPDNPGAVALEDNSFGTVEFSDGEILDAGSGEPIVTGLSGAVDWAKLDRSGSLSARGIWRNENFVLEASSARPLILFAGGAAPVSLNVKAAPGAGSFEGTVSLSGSGYFNGRVSFSTPALRSTFGWPEEHLPPGASGAASVSGKLSGDRIRLKLDEARLSLDGDSGAGVLDLSFAEKTPAISGTLAFGQLDLRAFLAAFTPFTPGAAGRPPAIDVAFFERLDLDLRLSAGRATAGRLTLTEVAATAQVKKEFAAFDLSDATIFGGTVQAGIRFNREGAGGNLEVRGLATNVDAASAAALAGPLGLSPNGKATLSLMLKGPGVDRYGFLSGATGTFSLLFGPGALDGIDLASFIDRARRNGFFSLREIASGSVPVERAEVRAALADGAARIEKAHAQLRDGRTVVATGVVPYVGGGLALSGAVLPADGRAAPEASFFVGGSWKAPFLSPSLSGALLNRLRIGESD